MLHKFFSYFYLFLFVVPQISCAQWPKMVFLHESETQGKQVGVSSEKGEFELITSGENWHLYPDISSDGGQVAYIEGSGKEDLGLVIQNLKTGETKRFPEEGFFLQPRFSKDGSKIVLSAKTAQDDRNKIMIYELLPSGKSKLRKIEEEGLPSYSPVLFADAQRVLYQRNGEQGREIVIRDLLREKVLVIDEGMAPSLSQDERYIAYTKKVDGNWDVYIYDLFEKNIIRVTDHPGRDFSPNFNGEGEVFYTSDRGEEGVFSIFFQSEKSWKEGLGEERLYLRREGESFYAPRFSGDARIKLEKASDMPGIPRSSFGAIAHNGFIYIAGGHQGREHTYPKESFTGRLSIYDTSLKTWRKGAPRNYPCHGFSLAAYGDYIYAFGGFAFDEKNIPGWKSLDMVERYDIKKDKWEVIGKLPRKRSSNIVATLAGKAYLIGGWDSTPRYKNDINGLFHESIDVFDLKTEKLTTLDVKLPRKRRAFSSFVKDGKIYLVGGISEGGSHFSLLDEVTVFDPEMNEFTEGPSLPFATFAPAVGSLGNSLYVFGGMYKTGKMSYEYVPHIYEYSFESKKWRHTGRYLKESKGFSQVVSWGDFLGILGGHSYKEGSDAPVQTFEVMSLKK